VANRPAVNNKNTPSVPNLVVAESPLFRETAAKYAKPGSTVLARYIEFIRTKKENPIALFGSPRTDKKNPDGTPMSQEVPGIRHAHLTHDVSVFYTISGANPSVLRVYAMLSHDEAGTGQPTNYKVQKSMGKRMANQQFNI
jgi:hypothetical protein